MLLCAPPRESNDSTNQSARAVVVKTLFPLVDRTGTGSVGPAVNVIYSYFVFVEFFVYVFNCFIRESRQIFLPVENISY